jgi:hypothetical protein
MKLRLELAMIDLLAVSIDRAGHYHYIIKSKKPLKKISVKGKQEGEKVKA